MKQKWNQSRCWFAEAQIGKCRRKKFDKVYWAVEWVHTRNHKGFISITHCLRTNGYPTLAPSGVFDGMEILCGCTGHTVMSYALKSIWLNILTFHILHFSICVWKCFEEQFHFLDEIFDQYWMYQMRCWTSIGYGRWNLWTALDILDNFFKQHQNWIESSYDRCCCTPVLH